MISDGVWLSYVTTSSSVDPKTARKSWSLVVYGVEGACEPINLTNDDHDLFSPGKTDEFKVNVINIYQCITPPPFDSQCIADS